jgi:hypothetical protein
MAIDANTLFGALSTTPEALAIFFLAMYSIASAGRELRGFYRCWGLG